MALAEVLDLACPFAGQERTYRVNDPAARPHQFRANVEKPILDGDHTIEAIGREAPAPLRVAPPGAAAAARSVDEDEVGFGLPFSKLFQLVGRIEKPDLDCSSCSFRAR